MGDKGLFVFYYLGIYVREFVYVCLCTCVCVRVFVYVHVMSYASDLRSRVTDQRYGVPRSSADDKDPITPAWTRKQTLTAQEVDDASRVLVAPP